MINCRLSYSYSVGEGLDPPLQNRYIYQHDKLKFLIPFQDALSRQKEESKLFHCSVSIPTVSAAADTVRA